jgi:hypothetical protein
MCEVKTAKRGCNSLLTITLFPFPFFFFFFFFFFTRSPLFG